MRTIRSIEERRSGSQPASDSAGPRPRSSAEPREQRAHSPSRPHRSSTPVRSARLWSSLLLALSATSCSALAPRPTMAARLYRVIVPVDDIDRGERFYAAVLDQPGLRVSPGRHYFDAGEVVLAVYDPAADGDEVGEGWRPHDNQYLYFAVPDLEAALSRVRTAGATIDGEIDEMPWGERLFYARDPFGNRICFVDDTTLFTGG